MGIFSWGRKESPKPWEKAKLRQEAEKKGRYDQNLDDLLSLRDDVGEEMSKATTLPTSGL
jgi:hypothetical protein